MFAFANRWLAAKTATDGHVVARGERAGASASLEKVTFRVPKERASLEVLAEVNLSIAAGEFLCLVGPSGSGKSTILNLFAGLIRPTTGRVVEAGREVAAPGPDRAVVFQEHALFPWLTLEDNVAFPLKMQGVSAAERRERTGELLRMVHLYSFRRSFPHELSGGMRQRGAIARALATDPAMLLMDEPFAALDAQTRELLQGEVERIWQQTRKTIVFVTHNVREAVRLGDRVVLLGTRPGRIVQEVDVDLPRPRALNDERVALLAKDVAKMIASEVDKVAKEEADDAWVAPGDRVRVDPRRNLGRGI